MAKLKPADAGMAPEVSVVTEVAKRSTVVMLQDWRTTSGAPVGVLCEEIPGDKCAAILGVLPGERPRLGLDPDDSPEEQKEAQDRLLVAAPSLIELGTSLRAPDGSRVSPAFAFPGGPRHELSLDGGRLSDHDLMNLTANLLKLSGCLGAAADASFLRRGRARVGDGARTVAVLPRDGADTAPGAP